MQFELTPALIDDIVFTMETQDWVSYLDTQEGMVVSEEEADLEDDDEDRYIGLPDWDSSEGYNLMERFAAGFKNKLIRTKLSAALNRGKGVFRAFKDTLSEHPEAEKLWYAYKDREMKREVIRWYNALREKWGLESIGEEPEETGDLVQEDFQFRPPKPADTDRAAELHRLCLEENPLPGASSLWSFPGSFALVAETGSGDFAGYINGALAGNALEITALEVLPEFRGLGLGKTLLTRITEMAVSGGISELLIDIPQKADSFSRVLLREFFSPCFTRYHRNIKER